MIAGTSTDAGTPAGPRPSRRSARAGRGRPRSRAPRRPLHLDDDAVAVAEHGSVDLGDRAGCHRVGLDAREHVLPRHPQLAFHHRHDLGFGERRHAVLQARRAPRGTRVGGGRAGSRGSGRAWRRWAGLVERLAKGGALVDAVVVRARMAEDLRAGPARAMIRPRRQGPPQQALVLGASLEAGDDSSTAGWAPDVLTMITVQRALWDTRLGMFPSRNSRRPGHAEVADDDGIDASYSMAWRIASAGSSFDDHLAVTTLTGQTSAKRRTFSSEVDVRLLRRQTRVEHLGGTTTWSTTRSAPIAGGEVGCPPDGRVGASEWVSGGEDGVRGAGNSVVVNGSFLAAILGEAGSPGIRQSADFSRVADLNAVARPFTA